MRRFQFRNRRLASYSTKHIFSSSFRVVPTALLDGQTSIVPSPRLTFQTMLNPKYNDITGYSCPTGMMYHSGGGTAGLHRIASDHLVCPVSKLRTIFSSYMHDRLHLGFLGKFLCHQISSLLY